MSKQVKLIILAMVALLSVAIVVYPKLSQQPEEQRPNVGQAQTGNQGNSNREPVAHVTPQPQMAVQQALEAKKPVFLEFYGSY